MSIVDTSRFLGSTHFLPSLRLIYLARRIASARAARVSCWFLG